MPNYAELHCISNFTFLKGASHPEELVLQAKKLGYSAIAITDECSVAGVVRAHSVAKEQGIKLIIGTEVLIENSIQLVLLAKNRLGYGQICELITKGRRSAPKGEYRITKENITTNLSETIGIWIPDTSLSISQQIDTAIFLKQCFANAIWIGIERIASNHEARRLRQLSAISREVSIPCVATGGVYMHSRDRRLLQDTLTAIRLRTTLKQAGHSLTPNGERHLRPITTLKKIYSNTLLQETINIANQCNFSLDTLKYEYPKEITPDNITPTRYLKKLTEKGLRWRFPNGTPEKVLILVKRELQLIKELGYEPYFLTVFDITDFARKQSILFQGRGSAANSAVCYALGITEVDPSRMEMLFERFISKERNEPPDIDVDFENGRREEVIQYIYNKYGRHRAALAATVVTYRPKSAFRDVGKALGLNLEQVNRITKNFAWWDKNSNRENRLQDAGFNTKTSVIKRLIQLTEDLAGFPRHLSQHVGGFVISQGPLSQLVATENAAMANRTIIQWDKDDLDTLGLLKVDILALGMLSAIKRALQLVSDRYQKPFSISDIPPEDPKVYQMISKADTIGVFQIESRAQMSMLPRLKPKCFYDLVIEVAIVRPGPIQGGMVHPYLERRQNKTLVTYPSDEVKQVLERTLGVPIFQEQVMQLAIVAAGFSPGEADQLRRSMAAWKRRGGLQIFEEKLITGMRDRGYNESFAKQIFQQILGFGEYGFPESHSASFALLVYVSCWLKYHEPAAFTCALLNSQPMGFYAPAQLIQDAQRHRVQILPVDIFKSSEECTLENNTLALKPMIRLGFNRVKGLSQKAITNIIAHRSSTKELELLIRKTQLSQKDINALSDARAFENILGNRHQANWWAAGIGLAPAPIFERSITPYEQIPLPVPSKGEDVIADYRSLGLTLGDHPLLLIRKNLNQRNLLTAKQLKLAANGSLVRTAGIVTCRQRPGTASGVVFVTLEDETGYSNIVIWRTTAESQRKTLINSQLLGVFGHIERDGEVVNLIAKKLIDYSSLFSNLTTRSRDFH